MIEIFAVLVGFMLDLLFGDPYWLCKVISHPIIIIGKLISKTEKVLRKVFIGGKNSQRVAGFFLVVIVIGVSGGCCYWMLKWLYYINFWVGFCAESFLCYQLFATRSLATESKKVYTAMKKDDIEESRLYLSYIVGRDTQNLDENSIIKATVETIAENTTDGVVAPMIYMLLFGGVGGVVYKAVNTMDSMVGYKNSQYQYFGTAGARLDDILNLLPARITAFFMILASGVLGYNWKNAIKIFKRDRYNHKSPNSAQTEAVMAGAMEIQLGGNGYYFGELVVKKTIGDKISMVKKDDVITANKIMYLTSIIAMAVMFTIVFIVM